MRGHKEVKMISGDEIDAFCARRYYHWTSGAAKKIKRGFNKRVRRKAALDIKIEAESLHNSGVKIHGSGQAYRASKDILADSRAQQQLAALKRILRRRVL